MDWQKAHEIREQFLGYFLTQEEAVSEVLSLMDEDYRREWPQAAYDWALEILRG